MSKKPAPAKHASGPATSAPTNRSEQTLSSAEITTLIHKKISDATSKITTDLRSEIAKLTDQHSQEVNTKLNQLTGEVQDANKAHSQRIEKIEKSVSGLQPSYDQLERRLKQELSGAIDEKVRSIQQNVRLETGTVKCSEQLGGGGEAGQQEELLKLHEQHHQDMLSVINDFCHQLKSSFNRQHKPYDVSEIHSVIDDVKQKMVQEILSEIQKTNTHEDLSLFTEALATAEPSGQLGVARDDGAKGPGMSVADISAALETFESETFDNWSDELRPTRGSVGAGELGEELPQGPIVEEVISRSQGMIMGDRGNVYYTEELKKTVDELLALSGNAESKDAVSKDAVDSTPDLPPKTKNYEEIEASLDSMIIADDPPSAAASSSSSVASPQKKTSSAEQTAKSFDALIASDIFVEPGSPSSAAFNRDLLSLDTLIAADLGGLSSPDGFADDLLALDATIAADRKVAPPTSSSSSVAKTDQALKSLEGRIEADPKAGAKSFEGRLESDIKKDAPVSKAKETVPAKSGQQATPAKEKTEAPPTQNAPPKQDKQTTKEPTKEPTKAPAAVKETPKKP